MPRHKYIAKIGTGKNAKYFYTMEEYNAYKNNIVKKGTKPMKNAMKKSEKVGSKPTSYRKALSSKDEERKFIKSQQRVQKKSKDWLDSELVKTTGTATINYGLRKQAGAATKKETKAYNNYEEAKTIKGKAKAVKKVFNYKHPKTAKRIKRGKKKVQKLLNKF